MRSYRIAMVAACPFPAPRGTPTRILRMAETLASRGHEIHIVTYHLGSPVDEDLLSIHRIPKVPTYRRFSPGPSYQKLLVLDPLLAGTLIELLRRQEIDLIHAHHFESVLAAWPAGQFLGKPIVFDAHTLLESELPTYDLGLPRRFKTRLGRALDRLAPRMADHTISVSEEIREKLVRDLGVAVQNTSVIPNGVEVDLFQDPRPRALLGPVGEEVLVFAGTMANYQRLDLMLRAFAHVCRVRPKVRLKVLTTGDFGPYEPLARELGIRGNLDVQPGEFADLPAELAGAAMGLSPRTECDGLPQKVLNYMAAGIPVVASAGSAKHVVHRERGLVVPDGDDRAFSEAILEILQDPEAGVRYGANGRRFVTEHMTWARTGKDVEAVYRLVLDQAPRS